MSGIVFSNLSKRLVTGILGAAIMVACIAWSQWTYLVLFSVICFFSLREFYQLSVRDGYAVQRVFGMVSGLSVFLLSFFVSAKIIPHYCYYLLFPLTSLIFLLKLYAKTEAKPFTNIAYTYLGIIYIAVPFALLNIAAFEDGYYNRQIILGCLFILWAADIGAYFAGSIFGKNKLFERISPKKSWEGVMGGVLLSVAVGVILSYGFTTLEAWKWMSIAVIMLVCGIYGDLVESLMKRSMEIKDSGNALPGHGGFLDRFDGLFISAPFIVAFLEIFHRPV